MKLPPDTATVAGAHSVSDCPCAFMPCTGGMRRQRAPPQQTPPGFACPGHSRKTAVPRPQPTAQRPPGGRSTLQCADFTTLAACGGTRSWSLCRTRQCGGGGPQRASTNTTSAKATSTRRSPGPLRRRRPFCFWARAGVPRSTPSPCRAGNRRCCAARQHAAQGRERTLAAGAASRAVAAAKAAVAGTTASAEMLVQRGHEKWGVQPQWRP